jgi:hypothetical protein
LPKYIAVDPFPGNFDPVDVWLWNGLVEDHFDCIIILSACVLAHFAVFLFRWGCLLKSEGKNSHDCGSQA